MNTRTLRAAILAASAILGLLGDLALHQSPLGLNVPVWVAALMVASALATPISPLHSGLVIPLLFFSGAVAWRASPLLTSWNVLAVLALLVLPVLQARSVALPTATIAEYLRGALRACAGTAFGLPRLAMATRPGSPAAGAGLRLGGSLVVGALLAVFPVLMFGALFASADPAFERLAQQALDWNLGAAAGHVGFAAVFAVGGGGYLAQFVLREPAGDRPATAGRRLGLVEVGVPVGATATVFAVFVALQLRYLFGGAAALHAATGLTVSEYARRGFFELVVASALVIPLLLTARWLLDDRRPRDLGVFNLLALAQLGLVGAVMLSALQRMALYVRSYGLTDDRLYATAFMIWVGVVLVWFGRTALRGAPRPFAFGAMVSGFTVLAALNLANPDALIATVNLGRAARGRELDWRYAARLGADARPVLLRGLPSLPAPARCALAAHFLDDGDPASAPSDWRGWNLARWRARRVTAGHRAELQRIVSSSPCAAAAGGAGIAGSPPPAITAGEGTSPESARPCARPPRRCSPPTTDPRREGAGTS